MSDSVQHRPGGDQVGGVLPKQQGQLEVLNVARLLSCVRTMRWLEPPPPPPPVRAGGGRAIAAIIATSSRSWSSWSSWSLWPLWPWASSSSSVRLVSQIGVVDRTVDLLAENQHHHIDPSRRSQRSRPARGVVHVARL